MSRRDYGAVARQDTIPTLNGIRAVAVALVFLSHCGLNKIVPGGLGVTIFFVLSGYLITTLMRIEFRRDGRLNLRAFYLRRFLRLTPPLLLMVVFACVLVHGGLLPGSFSPAGLAATLLYAENYLRLADPGAVPAGVDIVWSLAVEEHYYLVFPAIAAALMPRPRGALPRTLAGICALTLVWRIWLYQHGAIENRIYFGTDTRIDAILTGALLALCRNPWLDAPATKAEGHASRVAIAGAVTLLLTLVIRDEFFRNTLRYTLQGLAVAALIHGAVRLPHRPAFRWLESPLLRYLGVVSYSVYLFHLIILEALRFNHVAQSPILQGVLAAGLTLAIAEPIRRWVDTPVAALRRRLHQPATAQQIVIEPTS